MEFRLNCACGQQLTVTEGSAGAAVQCSCGRTVSVPPLKELRTRAGLSPYNLSPELVIETLLTQDEFPFPRTCVECGKDTEELVEVRTECERAWVQETGGITWATILVAYLFSWWFLLFRSLARPEHRVTVHGKDKIYLLPLPICEQCRPLLRNPREIKQRLCLIPEYHRLLEKFPEAEVALGNTWNAP